MAKLYLAGEVKSQEFDVLVQRSGMKRRLLSYHYHPNYDDDTRQSHEAGLDLFLDSGAFSAFTKGYVIDPHKYAKYLIDTGHIWTVRSNLDVIGSTEEGAVKTYENQKLIESLGASVHPVYHVREREYWLERYMAEGYDYILIGGLVAEGGSAYTRERLDHLFGDIICGEDGLPKVKVHGFGLTSQELMARYPWYSVDSSSWIQKGMYGLCMMPTSRGSFRAVVFSEDSNEMRKQDGWHWHSRSEIEKTEIKKWLEPSGVTVEECIGVNTELSGYRYRNIVNAWSYQQMERMIPERFAHKPVGFF